MSFICEKCKKPTPNGHKANKVVTETRPKTYPDGGEGTEIVHEALFCDECTPAGK